MLSGPVLHFCQAQLEYSKGYLSYRADTKSFSNKTKGDNSKSKKARVVNLVCDTSSHPDLYFYQVSSKYSKRYSSYRMDKKFYADADANADADNNWICPKNNMFSPPPRFGRGDIIDGVNTQISVILALINTTGHPKDQS